MGFFAFCISLVQALILEWQQILDFFGENQDQCTDLMMIPVLVSSIVHKVIPTIFYPQTQYIRTKSDNLYQLDCKGVNPRGRVPKGCLSVILVN